MGGGVGGGGRRGEGLPVVVSVGLPSGSWTQAWYFEAAGVSSVGGATHVVLRRCGREQRVRRVQRAVVGLWSVTVAGQELAHMTRWAFLFVVKKEKQLKKRSSAERGAGGGGERVGQT